MDTPTLILHHYPNSPFSEKVRLILGAKQLAWKSVLVPAILPKPDVVALTGGYRKTPFLQVGADIYCDTALIADVLEHVQPEPALYPLALKGVSRVFAQWADTTLFWAAMGYNLGPKGAAQMFAGAPPEVPAAKPAFPGSPFREAPAEADEPAPDWQNPPRIAAVTVAALQTMTGPPASDSRLAASSTSGPYPAAAVSCSWE